MSTYKWEAGNVADLVSATEDVLRLYKCNIQTPEMNALKEKLFTEFKGRVSTCHLQAFLFWLEEITRK
jgi:hypothetical protein